MISLFGAVEGLALGILFGWAIVAALLMGVVQSVVAVEYSPTWAALSFFVVLLAVLLVRPQGFFGLRERVL